MLSRAFIVAIILSCAIALGQSTASQRSDDPNPTPRQKGAISGKVTRSTDGAPLKKAVITLLPQQARGANFRAVSAITDADGIFLLKDLEPGRYNLTASRTGFVRQMYGQRGPGNAGTALNLLEGQTLKDINFRLVPGGAISGRVVDEDSEPISGVRLQALRWGYSNGRRQLVPAGGFAQTDDRGEYRMFQLAPGRYYLSATYTGTGYMGGGVTTGFGTSDASSEGYAPTYYPGVNDPAQATALELRGGDDLPGINLRLVPVRAVRVSGRIVRSGTSRELAWVQLFSRRLSGFSSLHRGVDTDGKGNFEISGVTPGSYFVVAEVEDGGKRLLARAAVEVDSSDVDGVILALQPPAEIKGQINLDGNFDSRPDHLRVMLSSEDPGPFSGGGSAAVQTDLNFVLNEVFDGDYVLRFFGLPPDAYVSAASMGKRDVLRDGVSVSGKADILSVVISASGGRLDGSVLDEDNNPFRGARVVLVPEETNWKRQELFKTANSDQNGQFTIRGIAPGKYKLFAWETIDEGAFYDPDFLRPILDDGKSVEVSPSSRAQVQVKVIRSDASRSVGGG